MEVSLGDEALGVGEFAIGDVAKGLGHGASGDDVPVGIPHWASGGLGRGLNEFFKEEIHLLWVEGDALDAGLGPDSMTEAVEGANGCSGEHPLLGFGGVLFVEDEVENGAGFDSPLDHFERGGFAASG